MDKKPDKEENTSLNPVKNEIFRFSSKIREANENYNQTIAGIEAWKKENNQKLDELEKQIDLRYGGTVIDADLLMRQKETEMLEQKVQEGIKKDREECKALSREIDNLLGNPPSKKQ